MANSVANQSSWKVSTSWPLPNINVSTTSTTNRIVNAAQDSIFLSTTKILRDNISSLYSNIEAEVKNSVITPSFNNLSTSTSTLTAEDGYIFNCKDGLILPCWYSDGALSTVIIHGLIYFFALLYIFVGVAIVSDRFMSSIEQITSQEKEIIVYNAGGSREIISVRIWNETVSNLTLMALGSSAPEILLSAIEIYAQNFQAGDLGPGTIVGSAAFNYFVIIAICVWAVPSNQIKKIKYLRVFIITLVCSVLAYVWMYTMLVWTSPGVITVTEGFLTLFFFFATVSLAYIADRRLLIYKYLDKRYKFRSQTTNASLSTPIKTTNGSVIKKLEDGTKEEKMELNNLEMVEAKGGQSSVHEQEILDAINGAIKHIDASEEDLRLIGENREYVIEILKDVYNRHPNAKEEEIEAIARAEIARLQPKSRAYYRMLASRRMLGSSADVPDDSCSSRDSLYPPASSPVKIVVAPVAEETGLTTRIKFDPVEYTVMEDCGAVQLTVRRIGDLDSMVVVNYRTEEGTAKANSDFIPKTDSITFGPGESYKQFSISIINDDEFEEDEHFFVRLFEAKYLSVAMDAEERPHLRLVEEVARINILDDDHSGVFTFLNNVFQIPETIGEYRIQVNRYCGARGTVAVPYKTIPATAKPGEDFQKAEGELIFNNNETNKFITLQIINNVTYEKNSIFYLELYEPIRRDDTSVDEGGAPRLGDLTKCMIRIRESKEFKVMVDNLMKRKRAVGAGDRAGSWENQIISAVKVHKLSASSSLNYDDIEQSKNFEDLMKKEQEKEDRSDEPKSCSDYLVHYLTLPWKLAFAFIPPSNIKNGYPCFFVSIFVIGFLTSLINDVSSHFGSTVYLKDSVTAISLVALGTSLPDTFASKIAAQNEKNADSSIGNVTGSNAVNVFLGIGIAWTLAAVYHSLNGSQFEVAAGSLGFSVLIFCICAFLCTAVLMIRRFFLGGELGGPLIPKIISVAVLVLLWILYLTLSTLETYGVIKGF